MISNPYLQGSLQSLSERTENWRAFHQSIRFFMVPLFGIILKFALSLRGLTGFQIQIRNSAATGTGFNVFRSDLDYSFVFPDEPPAATVQSLIQNCAELRTWFPFLGELEFYTQAEWQAKLHLQETYGKVFALILKLRKCDWETNKLKQAPSEFHRRKSDAALKRLMPDLPAQVKAWARINLSYSGEPVHIQGHSQYLGWSLATVPSANALHLFLSFHECVSFAAILPDGVFALPQMSAQIKTLRATTGLGQIYRAICRAELLVCASVRRSKTERDANLEHWIRTLEFDILSVTSIASNDVHRPEDNTAP